MLCGGAFAQDLTGTWQQIDDKSGSPKAIIEIRKESNNTYTGKIVKITSVHDKFHRTLILSGFCLLKIAKISLNSSFFPKPIKR